MYKMSLKYEGHDLIIWLGIDWADTTSREHRACCACHKQAKPFREVKIEVRPFEPPEQIDLARLTAHVQRVCLHGLPGCEGCVGTDDSLIEAIDRECQRLDDVILH